MDEQELANIENWYNNPPAGESYWQRVFNSGRVMGRLIDALRASQSRVTQLEAVRESAKEVRAAIKAFVLSDYADVEFNEMMNAQARLKDAIERTEAKGADNESE